MTKPISLVHNIEDFKSYNTDPYYKHLSKSQAIHAGWIEFSHTWLRPEFELSSRVITSNLIKISNYIDSIDEKASIPYVLLLTSGSFAPLHNGHLSMMNKAKEYFTSLGYSVLGGLISPSHDIYVQSKLNTGNYDIFNRLEQSMELINSDKAYEWLSVDCWEGVVLPVQINFSLLIERTCNYLKYHFPILSKVNFQVAYIFGDDNISFTEAFKHNGLCACVSRGTLNDDALDQYSTIHYISKNCDYIRMSSSQIRSQYNESDSLNMMHTNFIIRDDLDNATIHLKPTLESLEEFKNSIYKIFQPHFSNVKCLKYIYPEFKSSVLSLDAWYNGHNRLNVSRLFEHNDGQFKALAMVKSCGERRSILSQIKRLPEEDFILVDDDIATGFTINHISQLIINNTNVNIGGCASLLNHVHDTTQFPVHDVVDLRDFLFGSLHGGLTIKLLNQLQVRVPYMYPYVNLRTRASVTNSVSKEIIEANIKFYESNPHILLMHLPEYSRNFFTFLGFSMTDSLYYICEWHLRTYFYENTQHC